jgi:hypothetical protein
MLTTGQVTKLSLQHQVSKLDIGFAKPGLTEDLYIMHLLLAQ